MSSDGKTPITTRFAAIWPSFVIGLALALTIAWFAFLGWLLLRLASFIL
jgi:hypothetical protein